MPAATSVSSVSAATSISSVTSKGQVTIPLKFRQALGIRTGSKVEFYAAAGHLEVRVQSALAPSLSGAGMLKSRKNAVSADFDPATLLR